jgi:hypothetical protein
MAHSLPPEVTVTEGPHGACFRFPIRPLGPARSIGLVLLVLGLALCAAPLFPAWQFFRAIVGQIPIAAGFFWLLGLIFTLVLVRVGLRPIKVGLLILAGHSEIELRRDTLSAIECCGPLGWTRQRSTTDLRRFFVSAGPTPLNLLLRWSSDLGVLTPEWKAAVGDHKAQPLLLAPGYPRSWLLALGGGTGPPLRPVCWSDYRL